MRPPMRPADVRPPDVRPSDVRPPMLPDMRPAVHPGEILADELSELGMRQPRSHVRSMSRPTAYRKSFEDAAASPATLRFDSPAGSGPARSFGSTCKAPMTFALPRTEREMKSRGYQFVPMPRDGR